jgi:7 transmembrane sweet-taste receptor of 3 GCPR
MTCLLIANWQAYRARFIHQSEFSEAKYIGIACISMMQTGLVGIPTMFVVQNNPEAMYLVAVSMIFVVSFAVLLLIFVPKIVLVEIYSQYSVSIQRQMIHKSIEQVRRNSAGHMPLRRSSHSGISGLDLDRSSGVSGLDLDRVEVSELPKEGGSTQQVEYESKNERDFLAVEWLVSLGKLNRKAAVKTQAERGGAVSLKS